MNLFESQLFCLIFWGVIFLAALGIELATTELVSIWFCGGAIASLVIAAVGLPFWLQLVVWVVVSGVLLFVGRVYIVKKLKSRTTKTNTDALVGEKILVTTTVSESVNGEAKFRDIVWTIVSSDEIKAGEYAVVKEIKGNKLVVEKFDK